MDKRVCPVCDTPLQRNTDPDTDEVYWSCPVCGHVEDD